MEEGVRGATSTFMWRLAQAKAEERTHDAEEAAAKAEVARQRVEEGQNILIRKQEWRKQKHSHVMNMSIEKRQIR